MAPTDPDGSSTSAPRPSPSSRRSGRASPTSRSPGERAARGLTPSALRELAARRGIRPRKALGQHFLIEPALARRIVELAGVTPGDRVVEVGPGLGSLTLALTAAGADVLALEIDPALAAAVEDVTDRVGPGSVWVVTGDAVTVDWAALLGAGLADRDWAMVANLPYNVAVPVVMRALEEAPAIQRFLVMVQREVGERLAAGPGHEQYGAVSLRVAYRAQAKVLRRIARSVFWPEPGVDSVLVLLTRRPPPVTADPGPLFALVREAFGERRKTIRNALVRFGLSAEQAPAVLARCGIDPAARPESLGLEAFACLSEAASPLRRGPS